MILFETNYIKLINKILSEGEKKDCRNGVTISIFGEMLDAGNVSEAFPILSGRKMFINGILGELSAMLNGASSVKDFEKYGCNYWKKWADKDGNLELDYGTSWLNWNGVNQIERLIHTLKTNPDDRRMVISGWRPDRLEVLSLPCCHYAYNFNTSINADGSRNLNMLWIQRSVDTMVGLPTDAVFAAAWMIALANEVGMKPGNLKMCLGDTHIYEEHEKGVEAYLDQVKSVSVYNPTMDLVSEPGKPLVEVLPTDFELLRYDPRAAITFELKA